MNNSALPSQRQCTRQSSEVKVSSEGRVRFALSLQDSFSIWGRTQEHWVGWKCRGYKKRRDFCPWEPVPYINAIILWPPSQSFSASIPPARTRILLHTAQHPKLSTLSQHKGSGVGFYVCSSETPFLLTSFGGQVHLFSHHLLYIPNSCRFLALHTTANFYSPSLQHAPQSLCLWCTIKRRTTSQ